MVRRLTAITLVLLSLLALGCEDDPHDLDYLRKKDGGADAGPDAG